MAKTFNPTLRNDRWEWFYQCTFEAESMNGAIAVAEAKVEGSLATKYVEVEEVGTGRSAFWVHE